MNSRELNKQNRDDEKQARKAANVAKVEETKAKKEKDVWEKLQDEKRGISANSASPSDSPKNKSKKVRKVLSKNLLSHHRGHAKRPSYVFMQNGNTVEKVPWDKTSEYAALGHKFLSRQKAKKLLTK